MLTNNKKSTFIKSIAMIMAVLMVLAVALTGCGNKAAEEAAQKAENAQNTADEAKTAAEKIAADLAEHLDVDDPITVAAITAMITEALGNYPTTDDLVNYVKNEDMMNAINEKIAAMVGAEKVADQIVKALEGYVTSSGLGTELNGLKSELKTEISNAIANLAKDADLKDLLNKVTALESNKTTVANELAALKSKDTELQTKITAAESALNTAKTDLQNKINAANSNITTLQGKVTAAETELANLKAADSTLAADIAAAEQALADAKAELAAADKANADDIAALETAVEAAEAAIEALQAADVKLAEDIAAANTALETAVAALEAADKANADDIAALEADVEAAEAAITALQTEAAGLAEDIAAVQGEVDKVEKTLADHVAKLKGQDVLLNNRINEITKDYLTSANETALKALIGANADSITALFCRIEAIEADLNETTGKFVTNAALATEIAKLQAEDGKMAADIKELQDVVIAILEAFGVKAPSASDGETPSLSELLAQYNPGAITGIIAGKLSLSDWNDATDMIMSVIADIQGLVKKVYGADMNPATTLDNGIYTREDMDKINAAIAKIPAIDGGDLDKGKIVVFGTNDALTDKDTLVKYLEYYMLRMPTKEAMQKFAAAIAEAKAVKTFDEKMADLQNEIKTIGCEHTVSTKPANVVVKTTYQASTIDALDEFYAITEKIDALIAMYRWDVTSTSTGKNRFTGTKYDVATVDFADLTVYRVVKATRKSGLNAAQKDRYNTTEAYLIINVNTKVDANFTLTNFPKAYYTFAEVKENGKLVYTINDTKTKTFNNVATLAWADYYKTEGETGSTPALYALPTTATSFAWNTQDTQTVKFDNYTGVTTDAHGELDMVVTKKSKAEANLVETYNALYLQLQNALGAINDAVATFETFLTKVYNKGIVTAVENGKQKNYTLVEAVTNNAVRADGSKFANDNKSLLEALTKVLCEPETYVQGDDNYLTIAVEAAYEYALMINTCAMSQEKIRNSEHHCDELKTRLANGKDRYNLYFDMQAKAWELLFDEYQKRAMALVDKIINDYTAIANGVAAISTTNTQTIATTGYQTAEWNALKAQGLVSDETFFTAFLNGATEFTWTTGAAYSGTIKLTKKDFNNWAIVNYYGYAVNPITGAREYVQNNGVAKTATKNGDTVTATPVTADPLAVLAANKDAIKLLISANTLRVKSELAALTYDAPVFDDPANRDVEKCFTEYLQTTVNNLEEVYNRYLFEDYTKDVTNDLYTAVTTYADFYNVVADKDSLVEALQHYVTGYSILKSSYSVKGEDNKLFKNSDSEKALMDNGTVFYTLDAMNVPSNIFNDKDPANYLTVYYTATDMIKNVNKLAYTNTAVVPVRVDNQNVDTEVGASYLAVMENAAINYNFEAYLSTANSTVQYVYLQYKANAPKLTSLLVDALDFERGSALDYISVIEYQVNYNTHANALLAYKTYYRDMLSLIANQDEVTAKHFTYLVAGKNPTAANVTAAVNAEIAEIKSSDTSRDADPSATPPKKGEWNDVNPEVDVVVRPVQILTSRAQYYGFGSAAVALDQAANQYTQYHKKDANGNLMYTGTGANKKPVWVNLY